VISAARAHAAARPVGAAIAPARRPPRGAAGRCGRTPCTGRRPVVAAEQGYRPGPRSVRRSGRPVRAAPCNGSKASRVPSQARRVPSHREGSAPCLRHRSSPTVPGCAGPKGATGVKSDGVPGSRDGDHAGPRSITANTHPEAATGNSNPRCSCPRSPPCTTPPPAPTTTNAGPGERPTSRLSSASPATPLRTTNPRPHGTLQVADEPSWSTRDT
jgi:hypothetical protein